MNNQYVYFLLDTKDNTILCKDNNSYYKFVPMNDTYVSQIDFRFNSEELIKHTFRVNVGSIIRHRDNIEIPQEINNLFREHRYMYQRELWNFDKKILQDAYDNKRLKVVKGLLQMEMEI